MSIPIYVLLYFIISTLFMLAKNNEKSLKNATIISSVLVIFLIALRHSSMGIDLGTVSGEGYIGSFYRIGKIGWLSLLSQRHYLNYEFGYVFLSKLLYSIIPHHQFLLIVCAILSIAPMCFIISKYSENIYFSFMIYFSLPIFLLSYSGLRQSIALGICCFSCYFIEQKKLMRFVGCVLIAAFFHSSALMFLLAFPLFHLSISPKTRWMLMALLPITYIFRNQLFTWLCALIGIDGEIRDNGAIMFFLFLVALYILAFTLGNKKQNGWLNLFFVVCIIQSMASMNMLVLRVGYYYLVALPILFPNAINSIKDVKTRHLVNFAMIIFFVAYGFYSLRHSSWAKAYPYHFFWENL